MSHEIRATRAVVEFIERARWMDLPADAVAIGKRCIIDGLGVMLAGSTRDVSVILRNYVRGTDRRAESTAFAPEPFQTAPHPRRC